jgi:hypothetical protein
MRMELGRGEGKEIKCTETEQNGIGSHIRGIKESFKRLNVTERERCDFIQVVCCNIITTSASPRNMRVVLCYVTAIVTALSIGLKVQLIMPYETEYLITVFVKTVSEFVVRGLTADRELISSPPLPQLTLRMKCVPIHHRGESFTAVDISLRMKMMLVLSLCTLVSVLFWRFVLS